MPRYNLMLGVLLATLLATAAFEVAPHIQDGLAPVTNAPNPVASAAAPDVEPVAAYTEQVLARPLFTEGRHPAMAATIQAAQARPDKPPRLSGILVTGNDRHAIFEDGGKPVVATVGTQMGAYRILAITPLRVTLQGPAGVQAFSLAYGAEPGGAQATAAPSIIEQLNSGARPPPGMPQTPTFQDMLATLPKTMPPMLNGLPLNDTRPVR